LQLAHHSSAHPLITHPLIRSSAHPLISMINGRYKLMKRIGSGAFGLIFSAKNVNTDEVVAVKLEPTAQTDTLTHEAAVLQHLSNIPGIPTLRYYGIPDHNRYMVIDLYDKTLQTVSYEYKKAVPVALVRAYALQMMQILSAVHEKGFVHRDIKPENFMIKRCDGDDGDDASPLYLIDFGLARTYIDSETKMHRANRIRAADADGKISVTGTSRYISPNVHEGNEPSRRDDLISAMYVISYLLKGSLPWKTSGSNDSEALVEIKKKIRSEELFLGLPASYVDIFKYLSALPYDQKPDYAFIVSNL
jgi:serine/threonine protein kinase